MTKPPTITVTRHRYTTGIPASTRVDKRGDAILTARAKAFAMLGDVIPPGKMRHIVYVTIERKNPHFGAAMWEIGAEIYVSDQPLSDAQIDAITHTFAKETELSRADEIEIELREGGKNE